MIRIALLLGFLLSSVTMVSATAGFAQESSTETAVACASHIQRLTLIAPELICLHAPPRTASHQKSVA